MKLLDIQAAIGTAILLLSLPCDAKHSHQLTHLDGKRHNHRHIHKTIQASPRAEGTLNELETRSGQCAFPNGDGMVAVTPGAANAGWAMSPDQPCLPGNYCPYACDSGQVMTQWDPAATSYTYPLNMHGGLYCDNSGQVHKPFPDKPYCEPGTGAVGAQNTCSGVVSFCQTVLPGNEAMLIPTAVGAGSWSSIAVPGPDYWIESSAHFYVNTPGLTTEETCLWGDGTKPLGNWAPYAVGGQTTSSGQTFYKIGWNPKYMDDFSHIKPNFGVKIECEGSGCNGTPCSIDPSVVGIGGVTSADQSVGAGGASFCVVTIPSGGKANIVIFDSGNSDAGSGSPGSSSAAAPPSSTYTPAPPSSTAAPSSTSAAAATTSKASHTISLLPSSTVNTTSPTATPNLGAILFQNDTSTSSGVTPSGTAYSTANLTTPTPIPSTTKKSSASETFASGSILGFVILFAAAGYLL